MHVNHFFWLKGKGLLNNYKIHNNYYIHVPCKVTNLLRVVNPFTPKILLETLVIDYYAILLMFLWIIWYWINL